MKLQFKNSPTVVSEDMDGSTMGLAAGSGDMFTYFLRDKIYTDKCLAPIRETISNGWDEHVKYNVKRSLDVKMTKIDGQYIWSCRDYAKGLSDHDVRNVFGMYGASKKRDSNESIGGFGVGAASPLAYSDTFYVTSYFEGVKTQYACVLGGGDKGVEVGSIYEIFSEPTTETGLEVSFDVTKDYWAFESKTKNFVQNFLPNADICFNHGSNIYQPTIPLLTKTVGDYTINMYDKGTFGDTYYNNKVAIRMGGIVYKMSSNIPIKNPKGKIVVDVPIGKLTVPISREDIEDTEFNNKTLKEIEKAISELMQEDANKIVTPKFGATVLSGGYDSNYVGEWFTYSFSDTFGDSWSLKRRLNHVNSFKHNIVNGLYPIYIIPNIKSYRSWIKRLEHFLKMVAPNTQITWIYESSNPTLSTDTLDVSDVEFIEVKKLGLPKLPKLPNQTEYLVYFDSYKKGSFTAEDLDEYVTDKFFSDDGISDDWEKSCDSISKLRQRVIGLSSDFGLANPFWVCNSKKLRDQLVELGWFTPSSPAYIDRVNELKVIGDKKRNMENAEYRVKSALFRMTNPSKRTILAIGKSPNKISKLEKVKNDIIKEDSFRGRILKNLTDSYSSKITREDLRKLLKTV
jgi:hypothetical protein